MMTFKQFLAERRSTQIEVNKALKWMENNCLGYLNHGHWLYRGIKGEDTNRAMYANTDQGEPRKSIGNMANYYTLWMSHHPAWAGKPRRERSFITSSSMSDASSWGKLQLVIPADSAKIGAVGANDIWNKNIIPGMRLSQVTTHTKYVIKELHGNETFDTYGELAKAMKSITVEELRDIVKKHSYAFDEIFIHYVDNTKAKTLFEMWEIIFDPKHFEFMSPATVKGDGEFWIDGEALYIPVKGMNIEERETIMAWANANAPKFDSQLKKLWIDKDIEENPFAD